MARELADLSGPELMSRMAEAEAAIKAEMARIERQFIPNILKTLSPVPPSFLPHEVKHAVPETSASAPARS